MEHPPQRPWRLWWPFALAGLLAMALRLRGRPEPLLTNDGAQYLAITRVLRRTGAVATDIVYYDAERRLGRLPAPSVTFPAGLPGVLAAVVDVTGLRAEEAALAVNAAALLGVLAVLSLTATRLRVPVRWSVAAMALCVCNAQVLQLSVHVMTEPVFTLLVTVGLALVALPTRRTYLAAAWGGLLVGLSHQVRYAGLLVEAAMVVTCVCLAWRGVGERARRWGLAALVAAPIVAVGLLRNVLLVGNWRGGNDKAVWHAPTVVAYDTLRSLDSLVLGLRERSFDLVLHGAWWTLVVVALAASRRSHGGAASAESPENGARQGLAHSVAVEFTCIVAVYAAGMAWAALTTVISYGPRMFAPMVPLALITSMARVTTEAVVWTRRTSYVVALVASALALNLRTLAVPMSPSRFVGVDAALRARDTQGRSAYEALRAWRRGDDAILATEGQAVGHLLRAPTVVLASPEYSTATWDESAVRALARRTGARLLVLVRPRQPDERDTDAVPSDFVGRLVRGEALPQGFVRMFTSSGVCVYGVSSH